MSVQHPTPIKLMAGIQGLCSLFNYLISLPLTHGQLESLENLSTLPWPGGYTQLPDNKKRVEMDGRQAFQRADLAASGGQARGGNCLVCGSVCG